MVNRNRQILKTYHEPESPNEGACFMKRNRQMTGGGWVGGREGGVKIYDEPESPNEGACSGYISCIYLAYIYIYAFTYDAPESPNEVACSSSIYIYTHISIYIYVC